MNAAEPQKMPGGTKILDRTAAPSIRPILVTGGAGYIGSHVCKSLASNGFLPISYDNLVHGHEAAVRWGPLEQGDIVDRARLDEVMARYRPVGVMHLAGHAYVGESVDNPGKYYRNNVLGSLTLLEAMRDSGIGPIVFSSSCAAYGIVEAVPIAETVPLRPINPYGWSKAMVEQLLHDFVHAHGIRATALRYFNAAGADLELETGEAHDPETHLIPLTLAAAAGETGPLSVFGNDYPTPDGSCIRDYVHVADLAQAHLLALDRLLAGAPSATYNLGAGQGYSVLEVINAASEVTQRPVPHIFKGRRPGDPAILIGDPDKARAELGWTPGHSDIVTILQSAWAWKNCELAKLPLHPPPLAANELGRPRPTP